MTIVTIVALSVAIYVMVGVVLFGIAAWCLPVEELDAIAAVWWLPPLLIALWPVAALLALTHRSCPT